MSNTSLQPTWFGYVSSARDALILFEACLNGTLHHVARRPHDRERSQLIKSGFVFIYEENASGIKRWTDGVPWSPSRILGNFLVYRELEKPFPPGEKKRATKRNKRQSRPGEPYPRPEAQSPTSPTTPTSRNSENREDIRALIGSLVDSYGFKEDGLVKKTMSVNVHGVHHHLVSYYKVEDVLTGNLKTPTHDPRLMQIEPRSDLIARQNFRAPIDESSDDHGEAMNGANPYGYPGGYDARAPLISPQYAQGYGNVGPMPMYGGMAYSSAAYQAGMPSYAPMATSQTYYPTQQTPQAHSQLDNKDSRQSLPQPNYGYRPNLTTSSLGPVPTAAHSSVKMEDPNMNRAPGGHYAPTAAGGYLSNTSQSALQSPTYPSSANSYGYSSTSQQNLPSLVSGYGAPQDSGQNYMSMHSPLGAGPRQSYGGQAQSQQ